MLSLVERHRAEALIELEACEAERKDLKAKQGVLGARFHTVTTRLGLLNELRDELAGASKSASTQNDTEENNQ